jgi:Holliday junction resolvase
MAAISAAKPAPDFSGNGPRAINSLGGFDPCSLQDKPSRAQAKSRGGRASRDKGNRFERAIVRLLQDQGLAAERVPLSGAAGGSYCGDLTVSVLGQDLVVEAKARATGFSQLYAWLEGRDVLVIKADRRDALVILPLKLAIQIAAAVERAKDIP